MVTGGAGYIGSHTVRHLVDAGHEVVVLDNLYSGHEWAVPGEAQFFRGDIGDRDLVMEVVDGCDIGSVIHFAGHIVVPESIENPAKYYHNNVLGSFNLIQACIECGVGEIVFSSSAAVYGIPERCPVKETDPTRPINPYGSTKLITEWTLRDLSSTSESMRYVALRYFNVAGAHMGGGLGQATPEATHLIKVACQAACGMRPGMSIFGDDYETQDGTCIRDYIHVDDLAVAHLDALDYLRGRGESRVLNCGYGTGFSVKQVVECVKTVSNTDFPVKIESRRAGDPPQLIADNSEIRREFDWKPQYNDLETICRSAFQWESELAKG